MTHEPEHQPQEGATLGDPDDSLDAAEDDPTTRMDPSTHPKPDGAAADEHGAG